MLVIAGFGSRIAAALVAIAPADEVIEPARSPGARIDGDRYLFAQGYLAGRSRQEISREEAMRTYLVNLHQITEDIDRIVENNPRARIVVIGSESAFSGSYDETYADAKRQLSAYVERKRLTNPRQQLVCVAPSIIADAGMTTRRPDQARLAERASMHPKRRFLSAAEVARVVYYALYQDSGYLSGTTIRLHGGAPAWA